MPERTVTVREARAHLADHIDRAEQGTPTVITRNGVPVAVWAEGGATVTMAELSAELSAELFTTARNVHRDL
jgi:hypothetical protein